MNSKKVKVQCFLFVSCDMGGGGGGGTCSGSAG